MKKTPAISLIIPMYNSGGSIVQCLQSITEQSLKEIEIIIVNDASTDNSLELCQKFSKIDCRIKIIDKKINEGGALARRSGLMEAKGEFVCHVDSDDWLAEGALKKMFELATQHNVDIVVGNSYKVLDKYGLIRQKNLAGTFKKDQLISREEFMSNYYKNFFGINIFPVVMWGRIYRRSFLDTLMVNHIESNSYFVEDIIYNIQVFPEAKSIYFTSEYVYYYRYGGFTNKFNEMFMFSYLNMYDIKKEMITKYNYEKVKPFIIYELKNCLATYIEMLIRFKPNTYENIILDIEKVLNTMQFNEVIDFYFQEEESDLFIEALKGRNAATLYAIVSKSYSKKKFINQIKQIGSSILN